MGFYFETLFNTAVNNIDSSGAISGVVSVGGYLLLASLLFSIYENWKAQDVAALGTAAIRYFVACGILAVYTQAFLSVNHAFNLVALGINHAGANGVDVLVTWGKDMGQYLKGSGSTSLLGMVTGAAAGAISALFLLLSYAVFPLSSGIFAFLYCLYGCILFALGPIVMGLLPLRGLGQLGRTYVINIMVFNTWGIIYALFGCLLTALNLGTPQQVMNAGSFLGAFVGVSASVLLGMASLLLSVMILSIPVIAAKIVKGDVGSSVSGALRTVSAAARVISKFGGSGR